MEASLLLALRDTTGANGRQTDAVIWKMSKSVIKHNKLQQMAPELSQEREREKAD